MQRILVIQLVKTGMLCSASQFFSWLKLECYAAHLSYSATQNWNAMQRISVIQLVKTEMLCSASQFFSWSKLECYAAHLSFSAG